MKVTRTALPDVLLIEPRVFGDERGYFFETFAVDRYRDAGIAGPFVQDNVSRSARGIVRGLHLQHPHAQGKLVSVLEGAVVDVAVDVRAGSPSFGRWIAEELSSDNKRQLWIPPGFAHGFAVISEHALFAYKCTDTYHPEAEVGVRWNDPALAIDWRVSEREAVVSPKDRAHPALADIPLDRLPAYRAS